MMKKKNFKPNKLKLNKKTISSLESGSLSGGGTNSCLVNANNQCTDTQFAPCNTTNCITQVNCTTTTGGTTTGTTGATLSICGTLSISCPENGIC